MQVTDRTHLKFENKQRSIWPQFF